MTAVHAHADASGVLFSYSLAEDEVAYIDGDWLPGSCYDGPLRAIIVSHTGLFWDGALVIAPNESFDFDSLGLAAFLSLARLAVTHVSVPSGQRIAVPGDGILARAVRQLLGAAATTEASERPYACIVTSGQSDAIRQALAEVVDLGKVVLAAPAAASQISLDLYRDVHRRGLELEGLSLADAVATQLRLTQETPVIGPRSAPSGIRVPRAPWYRLASARSL